MNDYVLDRIEEGILVLVGEAETLRLAPGGALPPYAEGDVMQKGPDGLWRAQPEATARRRRESQALLNLILKKKKGKS